MLTDVMDGLKVVAEGIKNIKTIAEAVKSRRDYLKAKHPEVQADLRLLLGELGKSLFVIKRASAVLTNFRFAVAADTRGAELARFNNYFIASKTEAQTLAGQIEDLRTHCSTIRDHASKITDSLTASGFAKMFRLLGLNSPEREQELGERLDKLAYGDFEVANSATRMLTCLESALQDVQNNLGAGGTMHSARVPAAAALLAAYGVEFEKMEDQAAEAVREIREVATKLQ